MVDYNVTSPSTEQMWIAGNGQADMENLTVNNKSNAVEVIKENDSYVATLKATGIELNSETGKPDVCS